MTKLYMGSIEINWWKMNEVIRQFVVKNRLTFSEFLVMMWKENPLPNATYYARIKRNIIRANYIKRMEEMGIDTNLFIK